MEVNRDEANRCIDLAMEAIKANNFQRAQKFLIKSNSLYPTLEAKGISFLNCSTLQEKKILTLNQTIFLSQNYSTKYEQIKANSKQKMMEYVIEQKIIILTLLKRKVLQRKPQHHLQLERKPKNIQRNNMKCAVE